LPHHRHFKEAWQLSYEEGIKFELYRVKLSAQIFAGLKFKDVVMILYLRMQEVMLIGLEVKIADQVKVFVNPSEYVLEPVDYWGYVIHHE